MGLRERLAASATEIRARGQRLVELNVELLTAELKRKGEKYGTGVGLLVGAGVLALYVLGFALTTITVALALVLPLWLALLIVTVVLLIIVAILALVGRSSLRKAKTPVPERAIAEANTTVDLLKTNLQETARVFSPRRNGGARRRPNARPAGSQSPWTTSTPAGARNRGGPSRRPRPPVLRRCRHRCRPARRPRPRAGRSRRQPRRHPDPDPRPRPPRRPRRRQRPHRMRRCADGRPGENAGQVTRGRQFPHDPVSDTQH